MKYATKFTIVKYSLPLVVIGAFALIGLQTTHNLFAQSIPTPKLVLTLPDAQYKVGDDIAVMVSNVSDVNAYVMNNCPQEPLVVSRLENGTWVPLSVSAPISKCAGEPQDYEIPAEKSIRIDYGKWQSLFSQPGTYQIHAEIDPSEQGPSIQFTVE